MGASCYRQHRSSRQEETISNRSIVKENKAPIANPELSKPAAGHVFSVEELRATREKTKIQQGQSSLYQQFNQDFAQLKATYKSHDIDSCIPLLNSLEEQFQILQSQGVGLEGQEKSETEEYMKDVRERYNEMISLAKCLEKEGWEDQGEKDGIKMYSRRDGGTVGVLMEAEVDVPV